jgi:RNA-splicing ligase RtcB
MRARSLWPEVMTIDLLPNVVTEKWLTKKLNTLGMDEGTFWKSLGTIGGGNHFIEYGESVIKGAITMHFGSRNFGVKVCKHWMKKTVNPMTKAEAAEITAGLKLEWKKTHKSMEGFDAELKKTLQECRKSFIKGYLTGEDMRGYLCDMVLAQAYAKYNHFTVQNIISDILRKMRLPKIGDAVTCTHNYVDFRDHYIRKSSISAHLNEKVIVPLNMRDGTVFGFGKGNAEWMNSCSHGAGRKMSRSEAKKSVSMEEFKASMNGIVTTSVCEATLDESPMAYKDSEEITDLISESIDIMAVFKPKISWKAAEEPRQ